MRKGFAALALFSTALAWLVVGNTLWWHRFQPVPSVLDEATSSCGSNEDFFEEVWPIIVQTYYKNIPDTQAAKQKCQEGILRSGLPGCLDRHSRFLFPEDFATTQEQSSGTIAGGIGIEMRFEGNHVVVSKVIPGTPASECGCIQRGDFLTAINDLPITLGDKSPDALVAEVSQQLHGSIGSEVAVSVTHAGGLGVETFSLERAEIALPSVSVALLAEDISYVRIRQFSANTPEQVIAALTQFSSREDGSWRGTIMDLRHNPGGTVDSALLVSYLFARHLSDVMISYASDHAPSETKQVIDLLPRGVLALWSDAGVFADVPFVVLVDEGTASAAEIFIGIMRDWRHVVLIGIHTYGKGVMQTVLPLSRSHALSLTTHEFFLGNGHIAVNGKGFEPDYLVKSNQGVILGDSLEAVDRATDNQLEVAISVIQKIVHQ